MWVQARQNTKSGNNGKKKVQLSKKVGGQIFGRIVPAKRGGGDLDKGLPEPKRGQVVRDRREKKPRLLLELAP